MNSELKSVNARIGEAVIAFYKNRIAIGSPKFSANDLRRFVQFEVGVIAPGSADRILRAKRQSGALSYTVLSRSKSLYRFDVPTAVDGVVDIASNVTVGLAA